ncbi:patatin-like phospholipase family protein [Variovorax sp. Sphag1AA]|uniref:patatin-like phospholipase family protein n=1 Tax=Variovorax sp. Sphag1AA TaxID=2587027 RepID=UPI0016137325|nr:patatin-like phospholipase family protein [Variovorax sp. Sphag1AA]MBB3181811.1 hypothetical protein [Variovorax sp. Sphag1AA]
MKDDPEVLLSFERVRLREWEQIDKARFATGQVLLGDGLTGLALSGGGIRSATFSLGVLQALARAGALRRLDYLSTVSGGGYAGAWLTAWIARTSLTDVNQDLASRQPRPDGAPEAPEVTWLRRYSNYLAPKLGLLSADSITLLATWLRNVLLNLIIFVSFLAALFLLPRLLLVPATFGAIRMPTEVGYAAVWLAFFILPTGIALNFSRYFMQDGGRTIILMNATAGVFYIVILPGTLAALLGSLALFYGQGPTHKEILGVAFVAAILLLVAGAATWVISTIAPRRFRQTFDFKETVVFLVAYTVAIGVGALMVIYFVKALQLGSEYRVERVAHLLTFGPPALLVTLGAMGSVIVGLVGRTYFEQTREWWSRMNAWFIIVGVGWLLLVSLSFYAAPVLSWAYANLSGWAASLAGAGWVASLLTTLLVKKPTTAERVSTKVKSFVLNAALGVTVAGLLLFVAGGVGSTLEGLGGADESAANLTKTAIRPVELQVSALPGKDAVIKLIPTKKEALDFAAHLQESFKQQDRVQKSCIDFGVGGGIRQADPKGLNLLDCHWKEGSIDVTLVAFLGCVAICLLFGSRVDVNKFSLHNMYKNRLIRCYLGASRQGKRRAHPFTGFDEKDDIGLTKLDEVPVPWADARPPVRPFHLVNAAINITQGRHLAWQERKAASFTFSPLHCGFTLGPSVGDAKDAALLSSSDVKVGGYRSSEFWAATREERGRFSLGMAMATSGAAVSPLSGMHSTPAIGFLATLFNLRLGRWSPNPLARGDGWRQSSPRFGLYYLLSELFGYATETSNYIYLSDGGHFDNTGVYELVRRRCSTILVVDAGADLARGFDDLANMVRKCRVDFGVDIDFKFDKLGTSNEPASPSKGYVVGDITYPGRAEKGKLVVIKPTLIKLSALGVDLYSYSRGSSAFPQQTTVDQFFSESQFESYRALGERIAKDCLADRAVRI